MEAFDKLERGVWDASEARTYLELLLKALAHSRNVRAMLMNPLLTGDKQQNEYEKLQLEIEASLAKEIITPEDFCTVYQLSLYQPNLENSLSLFGRLGMLEPHPDW